MIWLKDKNIFRKTKTKMVNLYNSPSFWKNLLNQRQDFGKDSHVIPTSPIITITNFSYSEYVLENDEATEELSAKAKTWERNVRKLMVDLELSISKDNQYSNNELVKYDYWPFRITKQKVLV